MQMIGRSAASTLMAGQNRDNAESLNVTENALNLILGRFIYDGDLDGDGAIDYQEAAFDPAAPPADLPLPYLYYVSGSGAVDQPAATLLQRVANGEARAVSRSGLSQRIAASTAQLGVQDLFGSDFQPLLFVQDSDGTIRQSTRSWDAETAAKKAAAWLELALNDSGDMDVFVAAVGQVNGARSFVQQRIGTYTNEEEPADAPESTPDDDDGETVTETTEEYEEYYSNDDDDRDSPYRRASYETSYETTTSVSDSTSAGGERTLTKTVVTTEYRLSKKTKTKLVCSRRKTTTTETSGTPDPEPPTVVATNFNPNRGLWAEIRPR
jgi:hypothetical protein